MDRTSFIVATAVVLFIAFGLGWVAATVYARLARRSGEDIGELEQMAAALHAAEEARDEAIAHLHQREAELTNRLGQTEAELSAAMEGLRVTRSEAEELRSYIENNAQN